MPPPPEPVRAIAYLRQSAARAGESDTDSLSLRSQEARFRQWCDREGATAVAVVSDHDVRGTVADRPGLDELRRRIVAERPDTLWLFSLSRLARDVVIHFSLIRELHTLGIQHIVSETEGAVTDEFFHGIMALMHSKARTEMSAHLKGAFARRARDGGFPVGPTPIAYRRPHTITVTRANGTSYQRETGEPVIDADGAAFVLDLFERFDAGASLHQLACELAAQGPGPRGGSWTRRTVKRILQSPIYAGDIAHHGTVVAHDDRWQIVPRDLWARVQARMRRAVVVRNERARGSWLEGLVWHACGQRMYWQRYTGASPHRRAKGTAGASYPAVPQNQNGVKDDVGGAVRSTGYPVESACAPFAFPHQRLSSIAGQFLCRSYSDTSRCGHGRRIIGARLLETVVRECLLSDLGHLPTPATALETAQERSGGPDGVRTRARIDKALTTAQDRWKRNHERFSAGKLPPDVMDTEDTLLATAERVHAESIAALPQPPDPKRIARAHEELAAMRDVLEHASGERLRVFVEALGTVIVGEDGIGITYMDDAAAFVAVPSRISVPKGGKGFR